MTDSWIRSGIRKKFGRGAEITAEMIVATRKRITTIRAQKVLQLFAVTGQVIEVVDGKDERTQKEKDYEKFKNGLNLPSPKDSDEVT